MCFLAVLRIRILQATAAVSVSLTFVDLQYTVKLKGKSEKSILANMNGYIKPGTFVAIMGPSGE